MATPAQTPDLTSGIVGSQPPAPSPAASGGPTSGDDLSSGIVGSQSEDPSQTGYLTNDVGNRVIVPKDGESFNDTVKRAIEYHKSLSPEQQDQAMQREVATMPKKAAQTMGAAAAIGVAGPTMLATPGELGGAVAAGGKALLPVLTQGVVAIGAWAEAHPITAKLIYEGIKGAGWYKLLKTASRVGNAGE